MYRLEIWTMGVICVIFDVEFNFDTSWPTLGITDIIWPTVLYFDIQILNVDQVCKFWCRNEFWYQLTYFWYFWYNLTFILVFLTYRLEIWTRGVISDAELNFDINWPTFHIFYNVWPIVFFWGTVMLPYRMYKKIVPNCELQTTTPYMFCMWHFVFSFKKSF